MTTLPELRARRIIAQGLVGASRSAVEAARWMLALQGQTYPAGIRALALRGPGDDAAVLSAVNRFKVVRAWPQRGTLHFLAAEDARWLMRLCNPRVARAQAGRRPGLGLREEDVTVAREAFHAELLARGTQDPLPRPQAYEVFAAAGVDPGDNRGPHLLRAFGGEGDVVQGPRIGAVETFVHVDSLPVVQRELAGEEALAELGTRYLHSHGPASVKDLVWWAGLTVAQAKKAVALARDVVPLTVGGEEYWMGQWQTDVTGQELQEALAASFELPAFDEILLGYGDKSLVLADELRPQVLTKNGLSWPFLMTEGVVTGPVNRRAGSAR
ncbi:winged helix DNA-binding domain-containing protein [Corynebacterium sp. YIM 101645]|uniref:Winged helix DNA-binding domain-containing protein n=1 Tax=Corynebacterium lemuris TaxID=1859292 RepID=A0ABT2G1C6_9CORY|nr:winged helix DNA-binding domain-containing protein [Corynebacterium lemuris]MCS5480067.1 winged helix DNA-binding domain-containing protein [Corynebacterium lemuris]